MEWSRANQWFPIALGALVAAVVYEEILRMNKKTTGKIGRSKICPRLVGDRTKTWSHTGVHVSDPSNQSVLRHVWMRKCRSAHDRRRLFGPSLWETHL